MPKANHELASLEVLDKKSLKNASSTLKKNGETEVAKLFDSAISHINLAEVEAESMSVFNEEDFKKRYSSYE